MSPNYTQVSEVKLTYTNKVKSSERFSIRQSSDLYKFLVDYVYNPDTILLSESFKLILLSNANKVLGYYSMFEGGTGSTIVDIKMIIQAALLSNASAIIISHNHPSGQLVPSREDINLTQKIKQACDIFTIRILDHIIVTDEGYYSFSDEGRI